jgi:UDP:flavonoid glycosyltransferase YjiC (YdhE family)
VFRDAVRLEGFEARPLAGNVGAALSPHIGSIVGGRTAMAASRPIIRDWLAIDILAKVKDLESACTGADLLVARAGHLAAPIVAERLGLPWVQVAMTAMTFPSAHADPALLPLPIPGLRRAGWAAMELFARRLADPPVNEARRVLGLPAARDTMSRGGQSRELTAIAVSPAFSPPRPDWPVYVRTTGYLFWDVPAGWQEPPELTRFLDAAGPVVAISFGSMAPYVGDALAPLFAAAVAGVRAAGARALVIGAAVQPVDGVLALTYAPFSQVYPRCAAAIHHCGAYTTGEALRAGLPALAVPWGIDQFFTAAELMRTGAGRVAGRRRFTATLARREVEALLADTEVRGRARDMATRLAKEDGVGRLCAEVELVLSRTGGALAR